jgi:4-amino-4-deoxy-L-arabinose transferase-like glycosyltransferase
VPIYVSGAASHTLARSNLWLVVLVALTLRLVAVGFLYPERLHPDRDHWRFAGEAGRIAESIAEGKGFGNPFSAPTGPTAVMAPVYSYLLAAVFKICGIYSQASALVMLSLNALFSALTCLPIYYIALRDFGERVAAQASWLWALFPFAVYFAADFIWPTVLTTLFLSLLFLAVQHLENSSRPALDSLRLLYGLAALTEPIVVSVLPGLGLWACYRLRRRGQRWFLPAALGAIAFFAVVCPWTLRNYRASTAFISSATTLVGNFSLEITAPLGIGRHPACTHRPGARSGRSFSGEAPYMERKHQQAMAFIKSHRSWFAAVSLHRALYFWTNFWSLDKRYLAEEPFDPPNMVFSSALTGLALLGLRKAFRERLSIAAPLLLVFLCFPLTYYLTHMQDYYRRPIDPFFALLAIYAVTPRRPAVEVEPFEEAEELVEVSA